MSETTDNSSSQSKPGSSKQPLLGEDVRYFNPWGEIELSQNRVPHWQQTGALYFVTWRLADAIPKSKLELHYEEITAWKKRHPEPWDSETEAEYHKQFSSRLGKWLDAGYGSCLLKNPEYAKVVSDSLLHFEGERTAMVGFIIMPNHVHSLFAVNSDHGLAGMVRMWKSFTSKTINQLEGRRGEPLWQKDYFDRLIRDRKHLENCTRYIRNNPDKAKLQSGHYSLWESELAKTIL